MCVGLLACDEWSSLARLTLKDEPIGVDAGRFEDEELSSSPEVA
jgi:hypothetical protein